MRDEVIELLALGPLPAAEVAKEDIVRLEVYQELIESLAKPATDDEAIAVASLFGPDDCFGLAWGLLHFIESAPGWHRDSDLIERLPNVENEWVVSLRARLKRMKS